VRMKAASIHEIKEELQSLAPTRLTELCLRLARFKKDNKELLTYLLFEAADEPAYIAAIKAEMDREFDDLPKPNLYLTRKSLRRILRTTARQIRYAGSPQTEVELLTYFLRKMQHSGIPFRDSPVLVNLCKQQLKKVRSAIDGLHEDLQYDYLKGLQGLEG
jgi:hypothetical protein